MDNVTATCQTIQEKHPYLIDKWQLKVVFACIYVLLMLLATVGNALVIYVLAIKSLSLNVRTGCLLSLACSDLFIAVTSLPITATTILSREWVFPYFLCPALSMGMGGGIFVSSFTLTIIAVDRFFLIVHPEKSVMTTRKAELLVVLSWIIGYTLVSPSAFFSSVKDFESYGICGQVFCDESWKNDDFRRVYGMAVMLIQFGMPLVICSWCYLSISRHLMVRMKMRQEHERKQRQSSDDTFTNNNYSTVASRTVSAPNTKQCMLSSTSHVHEQSNSTGRQAARRRRSNRMMACMLCSFVLAWLPMNAINIGRDFNIVNPTTNHFVVAYTVSHIIAMSSTICNPIIYCWFNEQFRSVMISMLPEYWQKWLRDPANLPHIRPLLPRGAETTAVHSDSRRNTCDTVDSHSNSNLTAISRFKSWWPTLQRPRLQTMPTRSASPMVPPHPKAKVSAAMSVSAECHRLRTPTSRQRSMDTTTHHMAATPTPPRCVSPRPQQLDTTHSHVTSSVSVDKSLVSPSACRRPPPVSRSARDILAEAEETTSFMAGRTRLVLDKRRLTVPYKTAPAVAGLPRGSVGRPNIMLAMRQTSSLDKDTQSVTLMDYRTEILAEETGRLEPPRPAAANATAAAADDR